MLWLSSPCFRSALGIWSPSERWADLAFRSTRHMCQCGHCPDITVDLFQKSQPGSILALIHKVGSNVSGPPECSNPRGKCLRLCPAFILYHFFHVPITLSPPNIKRYFVSWPSTYFMLVTEQTAHLESSENPEMEHDTSLCVFIFLKLYSCIFDRGAGAQSPLLRADLCQPIIWSSGSEGKWPLDRWRSWTSWGSAVRQKEKQPFRSISISIGPCELICHALLWKVPFLSYYMLFISGLGGSIAGIVVTGWACLVRVMILSSRFVSVIFSSMLVPAIILG